MMKTPFKALALLLLAFSVTFTSCKKDNADPAQSTGGDSNWSFAGYTYARSSSAQSSSDTGDGGTLTAVVVTTAGDGGNHGAYSGSALTFTFYSRLANGAYTLANHEIMVSNSASKILAVTSKIGTEVATGTTL